MSLILNQPQAEAVCSAMCALNNVATNDGDMTLEFNGTIGEELGADSCRIQVRNTIGGRLLVNVFSSTFEREEFENQEAFATAYGLNSDEPQSCVAAAAGGLTQTAIER